MRHARRVGESLRLPLAVAQNSRVANAQQNGSGASSIDPDEHQSPRPVPELATGEGPSGFAASPARSSATVTDEDRNRYGVLLDRAVERGLLGPGEYQARLRELAEATSIEEMTEIVSALPAFGAGPSPATRPDVSSEAFAFGVLPTPTPTQGRRPPWALLVIVVVAIAVALVVLAVFAQHTVHNHNNGAQSAPVILSVPRL